MKNKTKTKAKTLKKVSTKAKTLKKVSTKAKTLKKVSTLQIGVTSQLKTLNNNLHVILWEVDENIFNLKDWLSKWDYHFYKGCNLTIYKSDKGYHIISLNEFDWKYILHQSIRFYDFICNNQLGYAIRQKSFTLRLTEKKFKYPILKKPEAIDILNYKHRPKEIIYNRIGKLPISRPHYELFKLYLNNPEYNNITNNNFPFFDNGFELKGYYWDEPDG